MAIGRHNPRQVPRFLDVHWTLVVEIQRGGRLTEGELVQLIRAYADASVSGERALRQLFDLRIVEACPGEERYEMVADVSRFIGWLRNEHRLASPQEIQAYIATIEDQRTRLAQAIGADDPADVIEYAIREIELTLDDLRNRVRATREQTMNIVEAVRSDESGQSLQARFREIRRLHEHYLYPMSDLLDPQHEADAEMTRLDHALRDHAQAIESTRPTLLTRIEQVHARLRHTRSRLVADFRVAVQEVHPLYERAIQDSTFAKGVARLLRGMRAHGQLPIPEDQVVALPRERAAGLFTDLALKASLSHVASVEPAPALTLPERPAERPRMERPLAYDDLVRRAREQRPADLLAWLGNDLRPREASLRQMLHAYCRLRVRLDARPAGDRTTVTFAGKALSAERHTLQFEEEAGR